jgi:hypothetical protein
MKWESEVGKWSGKSDEAESFNTWKHSNPVTIAKSNWEPVTGVTL